MNEKIVPVHQMGALVIDAGFAYKICQAFGDDGKELPEDKNEAVREAARILRENGVQGVHLLNCFHGSARYLTLTNEENDDLYSIAPDLPEFHRHFRDETVAYVEPRKQPSFFRGAYSRISELEREYTDMLDALGWGMFVLNFPMEDNIRTIEGYAKKEANER